MNSDRDESPEPESSVDPNSVEGVFIAALAYPAGDARLQFVKQACRDDADRLTRVEVLLRAYEDSGSFLQQPAANINPLDSLSQYLTPSEKPDVMGELGDYEILETIGRGGMGVVFRALDPKLNRVVAIKVLAPELSTNPNSRRRFLREAQSVASVAHPHIVTIHSVNDDRLPYFVMECIVGQSLQEKLDKSGALSLKEVLRIGQQVAEGLSAAHRQGIIHRDIKPANILLENGVERVRLTDFGLARARDDEPITLTGEVSGTPMYMSPEQTRGEAVYQRSDLFSLGAVLYAMCTGHSPFRGANMAVVVKNVCDIVPRPVSEFNSEFPAWLDILIGRLLDKDPDVRPANAESVAEALRLGLAGERPTVAAYSAPRSVASAVQSLSASQVRANSSSEEMTISDAVNLQAGQLKRLTVISLIVCLALLLVGQMNDLRFRIHPDRIWVLLLPIGLAQFLGWFTFHMSRFGLGKEAWWKGILASLTVLLMLPTFVLAVPVGLATLALFSRKGVKSAFQAAADGDHTALDATVPLPRSTFLMKCLGTAMTFSSCLYLFEAPNSPASPQVPQALLMTALISIGALLLHPLMQQFSRDNGNKELGFLRRPIIAGTLFAITTAILVAPFIPSFRASRNTKRTLRFVPQRHVATDASVDVFAMNEGQIAILERSERGGLIPDIDPGLVVELHRDGLTWQFSADGMISPRKIQQMGYGMTAAIDYESDYDASGSAGFGMGGYSAMGGMGMGEMMGGAGMSAATPFEHSDIFEVPVGTYEVIVFDTRVGWGRCEFYASAEGDDHLLEIEFGAFSVLSEGSGMGGDRNELPRPFRAAYKSSSIKIEPVQITALNIERNFAELAAIEPKWDTPDLLRFTWGRKVWTLDKLQAQCVLELLRSHGNQPSDPDYHRAEAELLDALKTDRESVSAIFNDGKHPAFGRLIVVDQSDPGQLKYRLSDLEKSPGKQSRSGFGEPGPGGGFGSDDMK